MNYRVSVKGRCTSTTDSIRVSSRQRQVTPHTYKCIMVCMHREYIGQLFRDSIVQCSLRVVLTLELFHHYYSTVNTHTCTYIDWLKAVEIDVYKKL